MSENIASTTADRFVADVIESEVPVVLDVWAPWCGPCRALAPELEKVAAARPDLKIVKLNSDDNAELVQRLGVASLPTLLVFKNGSETTRKIGAIPAKAIEALVDAH